MRSLIFSILMSVSSLCPHCGHEHPVLQIGTVESFSPKETVINIDGELSNWYLEDWYLEQGDKVIIFDCEIIDIIE